MTPLKCRIILLLCLLLVLSGAGILRQPGSAWAASNGPSEQDAVIPPPVIPMVLIVDGDEVYLFSYPKAPFQLGQRLEIFPVVLDDHGKISGPLGKPVATVRVIELDKEGAITKVINSSGLIKEGYIAKALPFEAADAAEAANLQARIPIMKEKETPPEVLPETGLERAEREGVPSPLRKIVVGRREIYQSRSEQFSGQHETLMEQRFSNEVLSQTETEYTIKLATLSYKLTVNGQEQNAAQMANREFTIVMRKDGKPTKMSNADYPLFESGGRMWPKDKIKIGDTWDYWTRTQYSEQGAVMKQLSRFRAAGLEQYMGRDCIIIDTETEYITEKQTGVENSQVPVTDTTSKGNMYLDYDRGIVLFHESTTQSLTKVPQSGQEFKTESTWWQKLISVE
jgi:hypothetical protein